MNLRPKLEHRSGSRIVFGMLLGVLISLTASMQLSAVEETPEHLQTKERVWTDSSGEFKLNATFVEYSDGKIVLEKADKKLVQISHKKLSSRDRQYVADHLRRVREFERHQRLARAKRDSKPDAKEGVSGKTDVEVKQPDKSDEIVIDIDTPELPNAKSMYGIDWYKSGEVASQVAKTKGDKPIMWFRVLGDLEGYM